MANVYFVYSSIDICTADEYACSSGMCIPESWQCDYYNDCGDNGDEVDGCVCDLSFEFECTAGGCINGTWMCDGEADCVDGSDEAADICDQTTTSPGKSVM